MRPIPRAASEAGTDRPRRGRRMAGVLLGALAFWSGSPAAAQDPVSGRWFATLDDAGGPARAVLVLEAQGESIRGRLVLRGSGGLEVQGHRDGQRVHLEFEVPEGRSVVAVAIDAEAFEGRMTGIWIARLPGGQRVERPWRAERTREREPSRR